MGQRKPTSHDVARLAGVSRTTVSYVLNGKESSIGISPATRARVLEAVGQLGYRPNAAGRSLRSPGPAFLGLAIREPADRLITNVFAPLVIKGISSVAAAADMRLLVEHVDEDRPDAYLDLIRLGYVDALVLSGANAADEDALAQYSASLPVVLWGRPTHAGLPFVDVDNVAGARAAVEYLISMGHRRIACILNASPQNTGPEAHDRLRGYLAALDARGIPHDLGLVRHARFDEGSGYQAAAALFAEGNPPTAVFAASDEVALGTLRAAKDAGLTVPQDVSVVGFDDIPSAELATPPLTTMHVPAHEIGARAATMCLDMLRSGARDSSVVIDAKLVVRETAGPPHPRSSSR